MLVDPVVSRAKFDREIAEYRVLEKQHMARGWWMLEAEFPTVFVVFATPKLQPPAVVFGAELDFTNYDFWPPSVRLVDPFTRVPYTQVELPSQLFRRVLQPVGNAMVPAAQPLMQAHAANDVPFLCIAGTRQYHQHPGHTGDSWLLHRGTAEGTLFFLLEKLYRYGVEPISTWGLQFKPVFNQQDVPE